MNETKEKIQAMIQKETSEKRKEALDEVRGKKSDKKDLLGIVAKEKLAIVMLGEKVKIKKGLLSVSLIVLLLLVSLGLFYAASITKTNVEINHQQQIQDNANKEVVSLTAKVREVLNGKVRYFDYILKVHEDINNFNKTSWQEVIKLELAALMAEQAIIEVIPANYNSDFIIDDVGLGYAVLSLLNELKNVGHNETEKHLTIEVHRANSDKAKLLLVRKVINRNAKLEENKVAGYIIASLSTTFMKTMLKDFNSDLGYVELLQLFSGKPISLVKKGDASLKNLSLVTSQKVKGTHWMLKLWPAAQNSKPDILSLWLPVILLLTGIIALLLSLIVLVSMVKKYFESRHLALSEQTSHRQNQPKTATSIASTLKEKEVMTDVMSNQKDVIAVEDGGASNADAEYLQKITGKIFRAYDVRGEVGKFINADVFHHIAYAIAAEMVAQQQTMISVGCDGRTSSPELVKAIIDALLESGINVLDIGMVTSPMLYYSATIKTNGNGVMVTASHNPKNYNGIKIMLDGQSYSDEHLQALRQRVINNERVSGEGQLLQLDIVESYMNKIMANVILARPMNIVVDSGNGVAGKFVGSFFGQLGCEVTEINSEVDGQFPKHDPDPSRPENLTELIEKVTELKADIGLAFDGDGDRIGLVSSGGDIIWPDRILMLLAKDILSRNENACVLYDVKSSVQLESYISSLGGKPMMCKSGHSFMKSKLQETGALLAGEMSGHIFIKERWYGFDDALFVAARILEILSADLRKSRQVFTELPDAVNTPEILIASEIGADIMQRISADLSCFGEGKIITIDGIRVEYPDGWGLVRSSNTTDNITMRFEANDEEALQRIAMIFKDAVLAVAPEIDFPF